MFIAAQIFGVLVIICTISAMQMKNKKQILFMLILANLFSSINFLLLKGYSGALICFFAMIQAIITTHFDNQGKSVPKLLIAIYIIISLILGFISYQSFLDILPIICSILYTTIIIQKKEKNIRLLSLVNILIWITYDLLYMAYTTAISDLITTISTLVGMYRFDFIKIPQYNWGISISAYKALILADAEASPV